MNAFSISGIQRIVSGSGGQAWRLHVRQINGGGLAKLLKSFSLGIQTWSGLVYGATFWYVDGL